MKKILDLIGAQVQAAFADAGYEARYGRVTLSNRPDLCEYQCNGALAAAKAYHKAPIVIAEEVLEKLEKLEMFSEVSAVKPGFLNLKLSGAYLVSYLSEIAQSDKLGCGPADSHRKVVLDYGGPNVAKPLHVGHLRSAVIGESLKRICRFMGDEVIGDVHLGDWGLQMGLIIEELKDRQPELPYFDENYRGEYPKEAPFTISELEEIYPAASARSKEDEVFAKRAHDATFRLQNREPGYWALWEHIMRVSVEDLKKNYEKLNVTFDIWKKESDAQPYIPGMIQRMKEKGLAHESQGALVVDVKQESDTKEIPPCMLVKSDGATLYPTTDLATLVEREELFDPDMVLYVVDKRQELHFTQVFRCAKMAGIVPDETELRFLGFGTMNGKDGKPFKTRAGGVMRLETLIGEITQAVYDKVQENRTVDEQEAWEMSGKIALSALKYGDLSNQASKDYIFDVDRFTAFEGNTGPYILYTIVRIKSILRKYAENIGGDPERAELREPVNSSEKALMLLLARFGDVMDQVYRELAPHKLCAYIYELSNTFNSFYHETKILAEQDRDRQSGYIALICLAKQVLEKSIDLLGFSAPDRM
ncbi:arginine--tRNA ligase [Cuneatibacter caecimuris]|uniref:Arginine--tRNA ligase n=1 Tax=Cuneatibacter caecimuris TaxID=1796618 RepID=A0A4Q7NZA1_9FIRM|nr:arginine--tRNA ligase [Cuneatibacter caecimuris]RZS92796.1 arginyl-tRNA synthetase [Cuneatibacter caecimuris]